MSDFLRVSPKAVKCTHSVLRTIVERHHHLCAYLLWTKKMSLTVSKMRRSACVPCEHRRTLQQLRSGRKVRSWQDASAVRTDRLVVLGPCAEPVPSHRRRPQVQPGGEGAPSAHWWSAVPDPPPNSRLP